MKTSSELEVIVVLKKSQDMIGKLSLALCYDDDEETAEVGQQINKLAHESFELLCRREDRVRSEQGLI